MSIYFALVLNKKKKERKEKAPLPRAASLLWYPFENQLFLKANLEKTPVLQGVRQVALCIKCNSESRIWVYWHYKTEEVCHFWKKKNLKKTESWEKGARLCGHVWSKDVMYIYSILKFNTNTCNLIKRYCFYSNVWPHYLVHLTFMCKVPVLNAYSVLLGHGVFNMLNKVLG